VHSGVAADRAVELISRIEEAPGEVVHRLRMALSRTVENLSRVVEEVPLLRAPLPRLQELPSMISKLIPPLLGCQ